MQQATEAPSWVGGGPFLGSAGLRDLVGPHYPIALDFKSLKWLLFLFRCSECSSDHFPYPSEPMARILVRSSSGERAQGAGVGRGTAQRSSASVEITPGSLRSVNF